MPSSSLSPEPVDDTAPPGLTEPGRPWIAKPSRVQVVALALISVLALGPVVALAFVLRSSHPAVRTLFTPPERHPKVNQLSATAISLTPSTGELRVRLLFQPETSLLDVSGRLRVPLTIGVNDARGATVQNFDVGQPLTPFEISVSLVGSELRYPFDHYTATSVAAVSIDEGNGRKAVPVDVGASTSVDDFVVTASQPSGAREEPQNFAVIEWKASRPATTTVYAVWMMLLMWALAVTGLFIVWAVIIWRVELPLWVFGYFVGVLFALPVVRGSLPGLPAPGTLFDYLSFYWSVAIVGATLILLLISWIRRARDEVAHREATKANEES